LKYERAQYYDFIINHKDSPPTFDLIKIQSLFDSADEIVGHNLCFDLHWLRQCGIKLKSNIRLYDTMIAEYIIMGQSKKYGELSLADLSDKYLETPKEDKVKVFWESGYETDEIPLGVLLPYMRRDVLNTRQIWAIQQGILEAKGMVKLARLQSELVGVVEEMEWNGMLVDLDTCKKREDECNAKYEELNIELNLFIEEVLPEFRDIPIKWTSGDHLSCILFGGGLVYDGKEQTVRVLKDGTIKYGERNAKLKIETKGLGFVPSKRTETKKQGFYQTDKAQMEQLKPKGKAQRRFLEILSEISSMEKLSGTYFGPFQAESIEGKFHPNFNQTATVTGRLTCSRLHQIPRDSDCGVKGVFLSEYPK
jgi:DNA polymerase I-like protein with 3'-5' exonuclease and polymerase domains